MKQCLKCNKEFEAKKETAKFCSTSCRVMYNRKHPSPQKTSLLDQMQQMQEGISQTLFRIEAMMSQGATQNVSSITASNNANTGKSQLPKVAIEAIKRNYVEERREISCDEEYLTWIEKLESDSRLTTKDKELVKNTH